LGERLTTTPKKRLFKIAEGCDRPFCAIPLMRGKHVSQTIEKLVKAEGLARDGVKDFDCAGFNLLWP
jgi:ribosomal protein S12 methylthiotransferase